MNSYITERSAVAGAAAPDENHKPHATRLRLIQRVGLADCLSALGCVLALLPLQVHAGWQDLAALRPVAEAFVQGQLRGTPGRIEINVGQAEPRLRLPACSQPEAFAPPGTRYWGNASVGIRCAGDNTWTLYLPVTVSVVAPVLVATRTLRRAETLTSADVSLRDMDLTRLPAGTLHDLEDAVGRVTRTNVAGGSVLRPEALRARPVVLQGEAVRLAYAGDGFEVHGAGRALSSGGLGEDVEVKTQSGRLLRGLVREKGWVVVR